MAQSESIADTMSDLSSIPRCPLIPSKTGHRDSKAERRGIASSVEEHKMVNAHLLSMYGKAKHMSYCSHFLDAIQDQKRFRLTEVGKRVVFSYHIPARALSFFRHESNDDPITQKGFTICQIREKLKLEMKKLMPKNAKPTPYSADDNMLQNYEAALGCLRVLMGALLARELIEEADGKTD